VSQSQASLNQTQVNRDHTVITAPIDGIVTQRSVDVGQTVAASMQAPTLFIIAADLTKMQVNANIDEADVGRIRPGQHVTFRVDAYPTDTFEGTVAQVRLQPVVVQNVTTYGTVIDVPNPQLKLKPGLTANVKVEIAKRSDALRIPNAALRFRPTPEYSRRSTNRSTGSAVRRHPRPRRRRGACGTGFARNTGHTVRFRGRRAATCHCPIGAEFEPGALGGPGSGAGSVSGQR
jgi:HlyD family secretion protein